MRAGWSIGDNSLIARDNQVIDSEIQVGKGPVVGSEERYEFCRTAQFLNGRAITIVRVSELV